MTLPASEAERLIADAVAREVPEVASGVVTIQAIARAPGVRTKIAVSSKDPGVDPVGACVGADERRIRAIRQVAPGEGFDIVPWAAAPERLIRHALAPVNVIALKLDPLTRHATVSVALDDLEKALGPHGVHRDLASRLIGWELDIQGPNAI